jgi:hypothetical protein
MHELHGHRAFANRRGNAFDGAMANIAGDEYAGYATFEPERVAPEIPAAWPPPIMQKIRAR